MQRFRRRMPLFPAEQGRSADADAETLAIGAEKRYNKDMKRFDFPLLIASNNANKLREIEAILGGRFSRVLTPAMLAVSLDPEETGSTLAENALIKCEAFRAVSPDTAILSDDSGLLVDALDGAPGVLSARYAGRHGDDAANNEKLLRDLDGVSDRTARFETVICLLFPDGTKLLGHGAVRGRILTQADGNGGFGYDPLFFCDELGESFGRASAERKNAVSHRKKALEDLLRQL